MQLVLGKDNKGTKMIKGGLMWRQGQKNVRNLKQGLHLVDFREQKIQPGIW